MQVEILGIQGNWQNVKNAAMTTIGKEAGKNPPSEWKRKILLAEHSPIRQIQVRWKWTDLPYWVSVHFVRHKIGIEHFVSTQRTDRTNIERDDKPQDAPVTHECIADLQAIINISKKRLCNCASKKTREAWKLFLNELSKLEPELVSVCVPECVYRGQCFEFYSCGYDKTDNFIINRMNYTKKIE